MLISCKYCNSYHERSFICDKKPKKEYKRNSIRAFRSSKAWRKKSEEIRERDLFLCQLCKLGLYGNKRYTFEGLEVHHIIPISEAYELRLTNNNLITLCSSHHKMADNKQIASDELLKIVAIREGIQAYNINSIEL